MRSCGRKWRRPRPLKVCTLPRRLIASLTGCFSDLLYFFFLFSSLVVSIMDTSNFFLENIGLQYIEPMDLSFTLRGSSPDSSLLSEENRPLLHVNGRNSSNFRLSFVTEFSVAFNVWPQYTMATNFFAAIHASNHKRKKKRSMQVDSANQSINDDCKPAVLIPKLESPQSSGSNDSGLDQSHSTSIEDYWAKMREMEYIRILKAHWDVIVARSAVSQQLPTAVVKTGSSGKSTATCSVSSFESTNFILDLFFCAQAHRRSVPTARKPRIENGVVTYTAGNCATHVVSSLKATVRFLFCLLHVLPDSTVFS